MWLDIEFAREAQSAVLTGMVRTLGLPGDRSDYHDLISLVWAACLRAADLASVRLIDIPHPFCEGELYGRYVVFDSQPAASYVTLLAPDYERLRLIMLVSACAARIFSALFVALGGDHESEEWDVGAGESWAKEVAQRLRFRLDHRFTLYNKRHRPGWSYFRRSDQGVVALRFDCPFSEFLPSAIVDTPPSILEGESGYFVQSCSIKNYIPTQCLKRLAKVLLAYDADFKTALPSLGNENVLLLPIESHLICLTRSGILSLETECGYRQFLEEREKLLSRQQAISSVLFSDANFEWSEALDDERFELLILELLNREPGVVWARKVGHSTASDAGRDILAEWYLGPAPWQDATEDGVLERKRIVVQCKTSAGSINQSKVGSIAATVELHDAQGYLLVAFPRITPQVVDYMTRVPSRRRFWADWWTRPEIEDRLRKNLDIARRYEDLVTLKDLNEPSRGD